MKSELHAWSRLLVTLAVVKIFAVNLALLWVESNEAARSIAATLNGSLYTEDYSGRPVPLAELLRKLADR